MRIIAEKDGLTLTRNRRALPVGLRVKSQRSQGVSNCVSALLEESGAVVMGDTRDPAAGLRLPGMAWAAMLRAAC
ncbi:DUF397 domain-containing protein [Nocardiopsis flavescens]|uniref:DUF397 domain-containing protein n=1 Tax=Nocardiopsis flavescens TaxID=758803 RepID=UPI003655CAEF